MARGTRIAAVVMTTGLLVGTSAAGVAAINQAISTPGSTSVVSAASAVVPPVVDVNSVLPSLDSAPALPSINKILKKAQASTPNSAATVWSTPQSAPVAQQQAAPVAQEPAEHEGESEDHEGYDD